MTGLLVVALIVASLIIVAWLVVYEARHKDTDADQLKARQSNVVPINRRRD
jgi:hypothetical protein